MRGRKREPKIEAKFDEKRRALSRNPAILKTAHWIYLGDARVMEELHSEPFVHLVVTSPPYWNLKEYPGLSGQLGNLASYREFLGELRRVWARCCRLLVPGGRLCVVVGDVCLSRRKAGRHSVVPLHADISRDCVEIGFDYLSPIFWYKIANAATEVTGNGTTFLGKPYEPNAVLKNDVEYILIFRKPGSYRTPTPEQRTLSIIDRKDHNRWFRQVWADIPGQARVQGHPAPFPKELAFRLISMFSFVGDTVLDPFWGTGTTTAAAIEAHRSSIGYEIEPHYLGIGRARFRQITLDTRVHLVSPGPDGIPSGAAHPSSGKASPLARAFTAEGSRDVRALAVR
ncbi:MAG: DNA-methyltransferase [Candidatus Methylomirabilales bacterium]